MCRICGIVSFKKEIDINVLKKMTNTMSHGGPDSEGFVCSNTNNSSFGFGHKRLSIIDLSKNGDQPMVFDEFTMVFNGEIYNYNEIREDLQSHGLSFNTNSDSEVILKSYSFWGKESFKRFRGMYSIAIFDKISNELILCRDRVGVKPLYWYFKDDIFIFSSEIKGIINHPCFDNELNLDAVPEFLSKGYFSEKQSIYKHINKLPPSNFLVFNNQNTINEYYYKKNQFDFDLDFNSEKDLINNLENVLVEGFKYRMVSDVNVGVFLSGGIDSTLVSTLLQQNMEKKLNTFTVGFESNAQNEATYAKKIANQLGTDHHEIYIDEKNYEKTLDESSYFFDEPFGDASAIPTMMISKSARKHIKVALSGDGADELFGGYTRHKTLSYSKLIINTPDFIKKIISNKVSYDNIIFNKFLKNKYSELDYKIFKFKNLFKANNQLHFFDLSSSHFNYNELDLLFKKFTFKEYSDNNLSTKDAMKLDFTNYLVSDVLTKTDRASMSVGLECREPFLDDKIIDFAGLIPEKFLIKDGETKYLLKKILNKYFSKDLVYRPKQGFSPPIKNWIETSLKSEIISMSMDNSFCEIFGLRKKYLQKIVNDYYLNSNFISPNFIWNIFTLYRWSKVWIK